MALVSGPTIGDAIADPSNELAKLVARENDDAKLDRRAVPPHPEPAGDRRRRSRPASKTFAADRRRPRASSPTTLGRREAECRPEAAQAGDASARRRSPTAKAELAAYEKELAPRLAEQEKQKAERIAKLEADLKEYEATLAGQARRVGEGPVGRPVRLGAARPEGARGHRRRRRSTKQADGSIFATGPEREAASTRSSPRPT